MHRTTAITLVAVALGLTSCTVPAADNEPAPGPRISAVRNEFMLQCMDAMKTPVSFWTVEEAWEKSSPDTLHGCRVTRTQGVGVASFSADDREAIRLAKGTETSAYWTDERVYALIIEACASWEPFVYTKTNPENGQMMHAARIVCPDAPFAEELDEAIDSGVTVRDAKSTT
ncbi:hypothetical protein HTS88_20935 [Pseudarthrobacter oxydans]|uniref:hypothetical protein n=1 Tax=Pseudarthrobacter oxydans TaxID=1671 RepID=UPI001571774B|nr:hypothetical protein [Pseudarthrobacter oxydans]NSX38847.1 hypothetical protein [Pseudarthrobacter oxydans]